MPNLVVRIDDFSISSVSGGHDGTASKAFNLSSIPAGSTITAATITGSTNGYGDSKATYNNKMVLVNGQNFSKNVLSDWGLAGLTVFGTITVVFSFAAYGAQGETRSSRFSDIALNITYSLPYSKCTAPATVKVNRSGVAPGAVVTLSWSGAKKGDNNAISGYKVYRATSASGTYKLLDTITATATSGSMQVIAPSSMTGSYYYKVRTVGTASGYDSDLSTAYAAVSVIITAPAAFTDVDFTPEQGAFHPGTPAIFTFSGAEAGTNNPITGYEIYSSNAANGVYSIFRTVLTENTGASIQIIIPYSGTQHYKVRTLGTYSDSSLKYAGYVEADMTYTSECSAPSSVLAGEDLTVTVESLTNEDQILYVELGDYSLSVERDADDDPEITCTIPLEWLNAMPNSAEAALRVTVQTIGGGIIKLDVSLVCPPNVVPTISTATVTPYSLTVPAAWDVYLENESAANVVINTAASAPYGAAIVSYSIVGGGLNVKATRTPIDEVGSTLAAGTHEIIVTVTDSRGKTGTQVLSITVLPYSRPTLMPYQTLRCDANGDTDDEGTYALAIATEVYTPVNGQNTVTTTVQYKLKTSSAWINAGTLTDGQLQFGNGNILTNQVYNVRYTIVDSLGYSTVINDIISRTQWELHVKRGGGAWAFGGVADKPGALHVYGDVIADNFKTMDMKYFNVAANGSYTFHMANYTHVILFFLGYTHASRGIMLISCGSSGNITGSLLSQSSSPQLALSGSDGDVTLTSSYGSAIYCLAIAYHGTKPTYN